MSGSSMITTSYTELIRRVRNIAKATVPSVRPSVRHTLRIEQLGSQGTNFHEIWYLNIFRKSIEKVQDALI